MQYENAHNLHCEFLSSFFWNFQIYKDSTPCLIQRLIIKHDESDHYIFNDCTPILYLLITNYYFFQLIYLFQFESFEIIITQVPKSTRLLICVNFNFEIILRIIIINSQYWVNYKKNSNLNK